MTRFCPPDAPVPARIAGDGFILRPLTVAHTALDYAAVMDSAPLLRRWSSSEWPAAGFTLADNRADLALHQQEHEARVAFTYTILDPSESTCLGCVYIKPNTVAELGPRDDDALLRFWVRQPLLGTGLDRRVLATARDLPAHGLAFGRVFFHANVDDRHQQRLFADAGLHARGPFAIPERHGIYIFYDAAAAERAGNA